MYFLFPNNATREVHLITVMAGVAYWLLSATLVPCLADFLPAVRGSQIIV